MVCKKAIFEYNTIRRTELEERRRNIENQRQAINKGIKESSQKVKMGKTNEYKKSMKEREEATEVSRNNKTKDIQEQIERIKAIRENNKNIGSNRKRMLNKTYGTENEKVYENNVEETKLLKEQIRQLELEEEALMQNLNKTKNRYDTYASNDKYGLLGSQTKDRKYRKRKISYDYNY